MQPRAGEITQLLTSWRQGERAALDRLVPLVRRELNEIALRHLGREGSGNPLQPSSLVQNAYLRLLAGADVEWRDRTHFFAVASQVMRRVLVDHARDRKRAKRGGGAVHIPVEAAAVPSATQLDQVVAIDLALNHLAECDERKSKVIEMRFFGGLSVEETAEVLGVSPNTVIRDWDFARAWLRRQLIAARTEDGTLAAD